MSPVSRLNLVDLPKMHLIISLIIGLRVCSVKNIQDKLTVNFLAMSELTCDVSFR